MKTDWNPIYLSYTSICLFFRVNFQFIYSRRSVLIIFPVIYCLFSSWSGLIGKIKYQKGKSVISRFLTQPNQKNVSYLSHFKMVFFFHFCSFFCESTCIQSGSICFGVQNMGGCMHFHDASSPMWFSGSLLNATPDDCLYASNASNQHYPLTFHSQC